MIAIDHSVATEDNGSIRTCNVAPSISRSTEDLPK